MTSKKDYEAAAKALNDALPIQGTTPTAAVITRSVVQQIAEDLARHFRQSNPRFDRERFLKACGVAS